jgi:O-antigen/teichoic acid export membrane protein
MVFCAIEFLTGWLQTYAHISQLETWAFLVGLGPMGLVGWHLIVLRFSHQSLSFSRLNLISRVLGPGLASVIIAVFAQQDRLLVFLTTISLAQMLSIYFSFQEMKRHPMSPYERKFFSARLGKEMTSYGLLVVPGAVLYSLVTLVDRLMLGWLSGNEQVALFALASTIAAVALTLKTWFSLVYNPHVIDWIATKDPSIYLPRLQNIVSFVSLIFFPVAVLACFWSRPVIGWIYPDFYLQASNLIPWIALSCAFSMVSMVAIVTTFVTRSPRWYFVVNALALACNCLVGWILIPRYGAKGARWRGDGSGRVRA